MVNNTVDQYSLRDKIVLGVLKVLVGFVIFALITQLYFVYCEIFKSPEENQQMVNEMSWKFDGTFKNSPGNIWYDENEHIYVSNVTNLVKAGKLAGNRNLEFGVKNVLEEFLQEKGYNITPDAPFTLDVDIIYLDQLTTKKGISVFSKTDNAVVIKLKGTLYKEGLKQKEVEVEESSSEVSMATLVVDQGGKFNQSSLSSALKKGCDKLITKLFEK
jgi:uncharacterized lipoprotein YajG